MLPFERVEKSLAHQVPDRVPLALWGGSYGIVDPLYMSLLEKFHLGEPTPPFREGHTINYMDDRILAALGTDIRYIWPGASPSSPTHPDGDYLYDDFGQPWRQTYPYYSATDGLLKNSTSISDIHNKVHWPDVNDPKWTRGVPERAKAIADSGYFIVGRMVVSHGPYQMACDLRGMENFMIDMLTQPDFAIALLDRVTDTICGLTSNYLESAGELMHMIELPGDDYAANDNLVFSPKLFRKMIRPCVEKIVNTIRTIRPDIKIMLHSDGAIGKLVPDFIEMGIDVLHPLEPVSGMDPAQIKRNYGDSISFLGGMDISHALPGTFDDVRRDVDRCIRDLAFGGGYIMAPCNHLQSDVPSENIVEMYNYAKVAGIYS
ncbi:MAG: uroporphyrinogen decarboxylase family protein [Anaerolineaceae bacterium]